MTRVLQLVSVIYLIALWAIFAVVMGDMHPPMAAEAGEDVANAIMLAGAIVLSIPAVVFLLLAHLGHPDRL
jgi:hypothetical protein